ncbi:hypothetical protein [Sinomicrobium pectinilyticum]|uniref:XRE family transcriptional regulator n=1 Tax=Sinomicrobium pectinilyticum TaxID=1084421 RepID=A0A3N0E779_SINP1|nr:hypothetical protein [Sinomicrobium pectinilyticum]RNL83704.1 hypothetical protein ED312_14565 [Sinomicrobium pectinilyticum]
MDLPKDNKRIRELIDYYHKGNVSAFSNAIGVDHQRVQRLFSIDKRSNKYPNASFDIIQKIILKYSEVNSEWLLVGKGSMHKETSKGNGCKEKVKELEKRIDLLTEANEALKEVKDFLKKRVQELESKKKT